MTDHAETRRVQDHGYRTEIGQWWCKSCDMNTDYCECADPTDEDEDAAEPVYLATFAADDPNLAAEITANHPHAITRTLDDGRVALFVQTDEELTFDEAEALGHDGSGRGLY